MRTAADRGTALVAGRSAFPEQGEWFVLHTRSRQEKAVVTTLLAMRIGCFLPLTHHVRTYGNRTCTVEIPLFQGYVFVRGNPEDTYSVDRTGRIVSIIRVADQDTLGNQLRSLNRIGTKEAHLSPCPYVARGMLVQVRDGPFRGLQGVADSAVKANRLVLQVDVLGQAVSLEVNAALLEPYSHVQGN